MSTQFNVHGISRQRVRCFFNVVIGLLFIGAPVSADTITLTSSKDNTLIEFTDGANSNALGDGVFAGRVGDFGDGKILRAVLAFDVSAIPAGSTINTAALTLTMIQTVSADQDFSLHRMLADWGEGTSVNIGGIGSKSTPGDATWIHTFYPDSTWTNAGGDFDANASAIQVVEGFTGAYTWTSPTLAADVQGWLDDPEMNFGWMLRGNENETFTAKKFASKDNRFVDDRPKLVIDFTPPAKCAGDVNNSGAVNVDDLLAVINAWGECSRPCPSLGACPADTTGNCTVNVDDLLAVINNWGECR